MCVSVRKYCLWPLTVSVMEYIINSAESLNIIIGGIALLIVSAGQAIDVVFNYWFKSIFGF